ncbi:hypothetical protein [Bradyrhizobium sp. USDA 4486]
MTDDKEAELQKQQTQDHGPRCPTCAAFPRLTQSLLDTRKGKTIRLFQCQCGERIWDD